MQINRKLYISRRIEKFIEHQEHVKDIKWEEIVDAVRESFEVISSIAESEYRLKVRGGPIKSYSGFRQ
ncbi:MAG: hypothetical protein CMF59_13570 [Leptospiraceae bacterium]|nr:hypothetical protein [Leptospiraceae bacterium]